MPRQKARPVCEGECFVVMNGAGEYWTGRAWSPRWQDARPFDGPGDPFADCQAAADRLGRQGGLGCCVAYLPRPEVAVGQRPQLHALRRVRGKKSDVAAPAAP